MPAHQGGAQTIRDSNARDAEAVCAANPPDDPLISAGAARALAGGISAMTLWRWRHVGIIPPPVVIQGRNYWRKRAFLAAIAAADQSRGA
jgi:hypothetical protein